MIGLGVDTRSEERRRLEALNDVLIEQRRRAHGGKLDLLGWTAIRRSQLKAGVLFDLVGHGYLRGLYEAQARRVVVFKASQMGASEWAISYALHAADERKATVLYLFPTEGDVSDFSSARVGPAIESSAYLERIVMEGGAAAQGGKKIRGADRVTLKRVGDRFLYMRGSQVRPDGKAPQLKSIDADVLVLDEVDEMDPRAPSIAVKRLGHSVIGEERWISTPTYPGFGIHAAWMASDQREWMVRCGKCGQRQAMTIGHVVREWDELERPREWNRDRQGRAYAGCEKCGKPLNRLGPGEWVAAYPKVQTVGFHLTKLFSPTAVLDELVANLQTTDETKRREAYNQDLGLPYLPKGGQLTDEVLDACRRDYAHGPKPGERTILGADVGKTIHVVIRSESLEPETGERAQRFAGEVESFEALGKLIRDYHVSRAVIDALPETREARKLQASFSKGVVWLAYYVNQRVGTKNQEPEVWNDVEGVVNLDRTRTLDRMFSRFFERKNTLPGNARVITGYYDMLKAPVRVLEDGPSGEKVAVYREATADHFAHAENYCEVAGQRGGPAAGTVAESESPVFERRRKSAWR